MRIAIGCDHAGLELKNEIINYLTDNYSIPYCDMGTFTNESVDYPKYAFEVAYAVSSGEFNRGILICGTGIGMSMVANKLPNVRAAVVFDSFSTEMSRLHNDSNILCLGSRVLGTDLALQLLSIWIRTEFEGGRHQRRIELFDKGYIQ